MKRKDDLNQQKPGGREQPKGAKPKKRRRFRRVAIITLSALAFLFFIVIPILLNIFADRIIGRSLSEMVHRETAGKYSLSFSDVSLNVFRRDISIDSVYLLPDSAYLFPVSASDSNFAILSVPRIELRGASWLRTVIKRELIIEDFLIDNPEINLNVGRHAPDAVADTTGTGFDYRELHSYVETYIDLLRIKRFNFNEGSIILTLRHDSLVDTIEVRNLSVAIHNFHLDSIAHRRTERLFFSDSLGFTLQEGSFRFRNASHEILFKALDVSSEQRSVVVQDLVVLKNKPSADNEGEAQYRAEVGKLGFSGADFVKIIESGSLKLDRILIDDPVLTLHPPKVKKPGEADGVSIARKIFDGVTAWFEPFEIGVVKIRNGLLEIPDTHKESIKKLTVPGIQLTLDHVLMDSAGYEQRSDFYFIDDLTFENSNQEIRFSISGVDMSYRGLSLQTAEDYLKIDGLKLSRQNGNEQAKIMIDIPGLLAEARDIKSGFIAREVDLKLLEFKQPNIEINSVKGKGGQQNDIQNLHSALPEEIKHVVIDNLRFDDADVKYRDDAGNSFSGKANLLLHEFLLHDTASRNTRILYSSFVEADFLNLDIFLPVLGHRALASDVKLNTAKNEMFITGLEIDTINDSGGNSNHKPKLLLTAGALLANGLDFRKLYFEREIYADSLNVIQPDLLILPGKKTRSVPNSKGKIPANWFLSHFGISNGSIAYQHPGSDQTLISADEMDVAIAGLRPGLPGEQALQADNLDAAFTGLTYILPDSLHGLNIGKLDLSSTDSTVRINNLNVTALHEDALDKGIINLSVPWISVSAIPLFDLYKNNELAARSIMINNPELTLIQKTASGPPASFHDFDPLIVKQNLLKSFNAVNVDSIEITNAGMELMSGGNISHTLMDAIGINLMVTDFHVEENIPMDRENLLFASGISLAVDSLVNSEPGKDDRLMIDNFRLSTPNNSLDIGSIKIDVGPGEGTTTEAGMLLKDITVSGIDYHKLLTGKKIELDKLEINQPDMTIKLKRQDEVETSRKTVAFNAHDLFSNHFHEFKAGDIQINQARLNLRDQQSGGADSYLFEQIDFRLRHILIDSTNRIFDDKFFYSDDLSFNVRDYSETSSDSLYDFGASLIRYNSSDAMMVVDSGYLKPNFSDSVFAARVGVQTDRMNLVFNQLRLNDFNMVEAIQNNTLSIGKAELFGLHGDDYRNKAYPLPPDHFPKLPVSALHGLDFTLRVDTLNVNNSNITYREYVPPALQPGRIWFTNIDLTGTNITNDSALIAANPDMKFKAHGQLMGEADLELEIHFLLNSDYDDFSATATVDNFDLTRLNPMLEHVAFVKVTKGYNEDLEMSFSANNDLATGDMDFTYNKLHIRLIDKETITARGFGESIASFIANTFVVRRNNPKLLIFYRDGDIYFRRDKQKSLFNYLAKSALSGVKSTIRGGNEERKEKRRKRKIERRLKREGTLNPKTMKELNKIR